MTTHHNLRNSGFSPRASYIIEDRATQGDPHAALVMRIAEPGATPYSIMDTLALAFLVSAIPLTIWAIGFFNL